MIKVLEEKRIYSTWIKDVIAPVAVEITQNPDDTITVKDTNSDRSVTSNSLSSALDKLNQMVDESFSTGEY